MSYVFSLISFIYICVCVCVCVCVCDFLELLMCAMSVQDILVGKSNGETKLNPMYRLWKPGLNMMKDANPVVHILVVL